MDHIQDFDGRPQGPEWIRPGTLEVEGRETEWILAGVLSWSGAEAFCGSDMVERGRCAMINSGRRRGGPKLYGEKKNASRTDFLRPHLSSMTIIFDVFEGKLKGMEDLNWQPIHTFCLCNTEQLEEFTAYIIRLNQGTTCNDARPERTKPSRRSIAVLIAGTVAASSSAPCGGERLFLLGRSHRSRSPQGTTRMASRHRHRR
jgi:hypothetical protein